MLGGSSGRVGLCITYPGNTSCDRVHLGGLAFLIHFLVDATGTHFSHPHYSFTTLPQVMGTRDFSFLAHVGLLLELSNATCLSVILLDFNNCWHCFSHLSVGI